MTARIPAIGSDELGRVIGWTYAAATGELSWSESLSNWASVFAAHGATLTVSGKDMTDLRSFCAVGDFRVAPMDYYQSELFPLDPRTIHVSRVPFGSVYCDSTLYDVQEMERDKTICAINEFVGVKYSLGIKLALPNETSIGLVMLFNEKQGHASAAATRAAKQLLPHVEQALSISFLAEVDALTRTALLNALARKADGVILLNDVGRATFLNDRAAAILREQDGLSLSVDSLAAFRSPECRKLSMLIARARSPAIDGNSPCGGKLLVSRPSRKLPYLVNVSPAPSTERFLASSTIAVVVEIIDLDMKREVSKKDLRDVFGLSEREADLAVALVRLGDLEGAAGICGMAFNTARNHLHNLFFKLDVHSQAELRRVLSQVIK